jgi:tRNA-specific 2-thiouridylase
MSGGVDSSTAAALLVEQGHEVTGVTMRLLEEDAPGGCCPSGSIRDAKSVCDLLGVGHYVLDFRSVFTATVVDRFCREYAEGRTPNPCIDCNDRVKFAALLSRALTNGADFLATGHYARVETDAMGASWLACGVDPGKDQSYFLYRATEQQLRHLLFPVGGHTKAEVRAIASERGLPTASRPESQEACFLAGTDARSFVRERVPETFVSGSFVDAGGTVVGSHDGAVGFTVGQRRGTGLAGGDPLYVTGVRPREGVVTVGPRDALAVRTVVADDVMWRAGSGPVAVTARARYRSPAMAATATVISSRLVVEFADPVWAVAPGQSVVCWDGTRVVGGGTVSEAR